MNQEVIKVDFSSLSAIFRCCNINNGLLFTQSQMLNDRQARRWAGTLRMKDLRLMKRFGIMLYVFCCI